MQNERLHRIVKIAMLGALAFILMYAGEVRVPFFPPFLKYDPGDVPAMIATYTLGPGAGLAVQGMKAGLFWVSGKSESGWIGVMANFLAGGGLVLGAGLVHRFFHKSGATAWGWGILSSAVGAVTMALVMLPILILMIYPLWGLSGGEAVHAAVYVSTPFNLFKGFVSSLISLAFYRRLAPFMLGRSTSRAA